MIIVAGRVAIKPERREEAVQAMAKVVQATQQEAGCLLYDFYADLADPNTILVFEEWESEEALNRHLQEAHTQEFLTLIPAMVAGEINIKRYVIEAVHGL